MLFNTSAFLVFFPVVTLLYFPLPYKVRWIWLLVASCFFYMYFRPVYILILAAVIAVDFSAGIFIERAGGNNKKKFLALSLAANLGILFIFKYYNFFDLSLSDLLHYGQPIAPLLRLALPIGLSFHTFQAMSYTIEVYRGRQRAERHLGLYALYVMFYPQLVAGPIERPQHLLHQFREKHDFDYDRVVSGLKLMMWGLFKKAVVADRLADITDRVFLTPQKYAGTTACVAVIFFAFQIYCDFSGYSDMAIGSARVMGFRLMRNFNRPYISTGFADFWRRWHISLSSWFRDYVYIPLGGSRVALPRRLMNIMIVFLLSGLWHGASWTFVIWGALHGLYYIGELILNKATGMGRPFRSLLLPRRIMTFLLVTAAWIFFRAETTAKAGIILRKIAQAPAEWLRPGRYAALIADIPTSLYRLMLCVLSIGMLGAVQQYHETYNINKTLQRQPRYARWLAYYTVLMIIFFFGVFEKREFIYFQF